MSSKQVHEDQTGKVLLLSDAVVAQVLDQTPLNVLSSSQEEAFRLYSQSGEDKKDDSQPQQQAAWEAPLRSSVTTSAHTHLFMPGRIKDMCSIKCVAVPNAQTSVKYPGIPGTGLVFDAATAKVRAILNQARLTAVRTAVGCLVACKSVLPDHVAHGERSPRLVVLGTGAQAIWHARVFAMYYGHITSVHFVGRAKHETKKAQDFLAEASETLKGVERQAQSPLEITYSTYDDETALYENLGQADLVCCCTPSHSALFDWTRYQTALNHKRRVHFSMIGSYKPFMQEVPVELIQQAAKDGLLFVDSVDACGHEAGDLIKAGVSGDECIEIGKVVSTGSGAGTASKPDAPLSVFKSVGIAVQDVAITQMVVEQARKLGLGQWVEF